MTTLREKVAHERRRLKSVREALSAGVAAGSGGDPAFIPFYIAIGRYMEAAMHRLHDQDVKMGDMIREKSGTIDARAQEALDELDERLEGNQRHLREFIAAREALESDGASALERFERAGEAYSGYITSSMGHHGATTEIAQKLFSPEDWEYMANVTDADMARERELHRAVFDALPGKLAGLQSSA
ncbi:MAG: hypothetical protein JJT85_03800 [Chromatiales bacterium]|nr:hypothetical protein [Chromatiales bacterium]